MKRKPNNWGDMLKVVSCVNHPELDDVHCRWLMGLALSASKTGEHSYPGYAALCQRTGRKFDRQRIYSNHLEKLGLVEIVKKGNGPGAANVYRICLEHAAFPDDYIGLNSDNPTSYGKGDTLSNPTSVVKGDSASQSHLSARESHLFSQSIPLVFGTIPLAEGSDYPKTLALTPIQEPNYTSQVAEYSRVGTKAKTSLAEREELLAVFTKLENEAPNTTSFQDRQIDKLIEEYGLEKCCQVMRRDLRTSAFRTDKKGKRTELPLYRFIKNFTRLLKEVDVTTRVPLKKEIIAATNEQAKKNHNELFTDPEPNNEPSAEDFVTSETQMRSKQ